MRSNSYALAVIVVVFANACGYVVVSRMSKSRLMLMLRFGGWVKSSEVVAVENDQ